MLGPTDSQVKANSSHKWTPPEGSGQAERNGCKGLSKATQMALRTKDKESKDTGELLRWIKNLNLVLRRQKWWELEAQFEPKGKLLKLLVDRDSANSMKKPML
jgi:hypothetical protein